MIDAPPLADISRLGLNQITLNNLTLKECAAACVRHGLQWIGPWRQRIEEIGIADSARILSDSGLRVSGLCRGGFFPAPSPGERQKRIDDNLRAIDEAAQLRAECLVLVCGPASDRDIAAARSMVADGIAAIAAHARARGVRLGIEPLHPMFAADRSVIVTLGQAVDLALQFDAADVGVVVDTFHVWWDPRLHEELRRASGRIVSYHVSDWSSVSGDIAKCRHMMGDGIIELRRIRKGVEDAGYCGPIEIEIMNESIWNRPADPVMKEMIERFLACV